jgi:mRNA-degrading endonuclease RelE of RelBE toxin-antitoxin system
MSEGDSWPNRTTKQFRKQLGDLPEEVQRQARKAFKLYETDPNHPSLNFERLNVRGEYYSARVSQQYRVLAKRKPDHMLWFWIGTHDEYEKLLSRL